MEAVLPPGDQQQQQPPGGDDQTASGSSQQVETLQQQQQPSTNEHGEGPAPSVASDGYLSADRAGRTAILPSIGRFRKEDVIKHISQSPMGRGIDAIIFFTAAACKLVFSSVEMAEGWVVRGIDIGSHHFDLALEKDAKPPMWITMRNIPLETGNSDVRHKLGEYGRILKGPFYNNHPGTKIKNGLRSALIVVTKDIPSVMYVEDSVNKVRRTVTVFHKGQTPKCFRCNGPHLKKDCTQAVGLRKTGGKGKGAGKSWGDKGGSGTPLSQTKAHHAPTQAPASPPSMDLDSLSEFPLINDERKSMDVEEATLKRTRDSDADTVSVSSPSKSGSRRHTQRRKSMRKDKTSNLDSDSDMSGNESNRPVDLDHTEGITPLDDTVEKDLQDLELPAEDTPANVDNVEPAEDVTKTSTTATGDYDAASFAYNESQRNSTTEEGLDPFYKVQFLKEADKIKKDSDFKLTRAKDKLIKKQNQSVFAEIKALRKKGL